jgi:glycine cleavage system H protein
MVNREELLYSPTHEWVAVETDASGQKIATVGITDFAVEALTDLVHIELPQPGRMVDAGRSFGEIESVKAVSDLYAPLSGEVVEVNQSLADRLETLSEDPFGAGWIVKIRVTDESGMSQLMDRAAYEKQCAEEEH